MRRYDPHVSWPYTKCNGARADGECCQARVDSGGVYCHHHDPARTSLMSTPTAPLTEITALNDSGQRVSENRSSTSPPDRGSVPDETTLAAFAEAMRGVRESRRKMSEHTRIAE